MSLPIIPASWDSYGFFFDAARMPILLQTIVSGSDEARQRAWDDLSHEIAHQGTVLDGALVAIPILGHLLKHGMLPDPDGAAGLLAWCVVSRPYATRVAPELRQDVGTAWDTWNLAERNHWLSHAIRAAVSPFVPLLYPYARSPWEVRDIVIPALAHFVEQSSASRAVVDAALLDERDPLARRMLQCCAIHLSGGVLGLEDRRRLYLPSDDEDNR